MKRIVDRHGGPRDVTTKAPVPVVRGGTKLQGIAKPAGELAGKLQRRQGMRR